MIVGVFSCSACVSGQKVSKKRHCVGVLLCLADPPSRISSEGGLVWLGKALTQKSRGGLGVGNRNPRLAIRVREGWCDVAHWSQGEQKTTDTKTHPTMSVFSCSMRSCNK